MCRDNVFAYHVFDYKALTFLDLDLQARVRFALQLHHVHQMDVLCCCSFFQFKHSNSELTSGVGKRSETNASRSGLPISKHSNVIRSGWIQYRSDPTDTDFIDYFKKCENFEGMRMHKQIDKGEWVYFNRKWDLFFNKEAVLILRWEIMMIKKMKPIFNVPVIVIDWQAALVAIDGRGVLVTDWNRTIELAMQREVLCVCIRFTFIL